MATQFGTFNKNANVFDQSDLTKYIKENSITSLQTDAVDGSIASKIKALEDRDPVSFADVSTVISGNISQDLLNNAEATSVLGRLSTLEDTVGVINAEIQNILDGNV